MAYGLHTLIAAWRGAGHGVEIETDPARAMTADVVIPHLDLTVVPARIRRVLDRHACVVNRALWDISKRRISANLVARGDGWTGPVIAKSDLNCGGAPERIHLANRGWPYRAWRALVGRLPGGDRRAARDLGPYRIFAGKDEVPDAIWRNPAWVVERFLPERDGDRFVVRQVWLFGDRHFSMIGHHRAPIGKGANVLDWRIAHDPLPPALLRFCVERGIDYAKIDFALPEGRLVVFDVNRTPVGDIIQDSCPHELAALAAGLAAVVAKCTRRID